MEPMQSLVFTVMGPDRPGLVEALASVVRQHDGSWQQSSMAHLADQFAGVVSVLVARERVAYYAMGESGKANGPGNEWRSAETWPVPNTPTSGAAPRALASASRDTTRRFEPSTAKR